MFDLIKTLKIHVVVSALSLVACGENKEWIEVPLAENVYYPQDQEFKQGQYDIAVPSGEGLEFKLALKTGDSIVYHWTVDISLPALLLAEFHGHTERVGDEAGTVMFYKQHNNGKEEGSLVAPFDGIHGWYFRNDSGDDVVVNLSVAGFYDEVK